MKKKAALSFWVASLSCVFSLAACNGDTSSAPDEGTAADKTMVDDIALAEESRGENWLAYGRTFSEQRYSPLSEINGDNVAELGVDWYMDLPNNFRRSPKIIVASSTWSRK